MGIIVMIEDDTLIQETLRRLFEAENHEVQFLHDGVNAKEATRAPGVEAVVLDLMLPKISGREVCRSIKDRQPNLPVVILNAVSEVADKVLLLELWPRLNAKFRADATVTMLAPGDSIGEESLARGSEIQDQCRE